MNTHDRSAKNPTDTSYRQHLHEPPIQHDLSGLGSFYGMQQAIRKPNRESLTPNTILRLQRTIGNAAVQRLVNASEGMQKRTLIVEDSAEELSPGQMKQTEFLELLYHELHKVGTEEYEGTNLTVARCPYIEYWFSRYRQETSTRIERAAQKYIGDSSNIGSTNQLIEKICERARLGFKAQVQTGEVTELPGDVPEEVGEDILPEKEQIVQETDEVIQRGCLKGGADAQHADAEPAQPQSQYHWIGQNGTAIAQQGDTVQNAGTTSCALVLGFGAGGQVACYHWPGLVFNGGYQGKFAGLLAEIQQPITQIVIISNDFPNQEERQSYRESALNIQAANNGIAMSYFVRAGEITGDPYVRLQNGTVASMLGALRQEI